MSSSSLVLALTILIAIILVLLILWVLIRYVRIRRARRTQCHTQDSQDASFLAASAENSTQLHCTQPSDTLYHDVGIELQRVPVRDNDEAEKTEVWLRRGASKDGLREGDGGAEQRVRVREAEGNVLGTRAMKL
ncbi:hypothetical protein OPT61_g2892 [Boeremia exigua]|uniref:Uncharacterized protein n=1 Tax=Boeremia exigua TaxID=749465 RepID=A0ACC2IK42_9PLEO|nr:hypothetical protein OPT61_g2892 [Boeremia exigua]